VKRSEDRETLDKSETKILKIKENEILGYRKHTRHKKRRKEEKDIICVRFVRNEQISERTNWDRLHSLSLTKSRSG